MIPLPGGLVELFGSKQVRHVIRFCPLKIKEPKRKINKKRKEPLIVCAILKVTPFFFFFFSFDSEVHDLFMLTILLKKFLFNIGCSFQRYLKMGMLWILSHLNSTFQ